MPDATLRCAGRAEAELVVAILAEQGIHAVAFCDVERGPQGEVVRERADVRIVPADVERARAALAEWTAARREPVDPAELERQALEAGDAEVAPGGSPAPRDDREGRGPPAASTSPDAPTCPYCGADVRAGTLARVRGVLAALRGRTARARGERLCTSCGHRWGADDGAATPRDAGP